LGFMDINGEQICLECLDYMSNPVNRCMECR
jgi:hypothetical protein